MSDNPQTEIILPLSDSEKRERDELEKIMDRTEASGLEYIRALKVYRDKRLYRDQFDNFDLYLANCRKAFKRQRVSQLIKHVETMDTLARQPGVDTLPESERQTRALRALEDPTEQKAAWLLAQQASGKDQPESTWVKGSVETIEQMRITGGYVDVGNGKMSNAAASTIQNVSDAKSRQRDHINGHKRVKPIVLEGVFKDRGKEEASKYATVYLPELTDEVWQKLSTGEVLRFVLYPVVEGKS